MQCPYCRHPLEPLILQGRPTGAFQCIRCAGSWLQYQQFGGLIGSGSSGPTGLTRWNSGESSSLALHSEPNPYQSPQSPWQHMGPAPGYGPNGPLPGYGARGASSPPRPSRQPWWRRKRAAEAPAENPDWDLCTYCGQLHPGGGRNCAHCNVERMRCPQCGAFMVGVRRFQVLVDLCLGCQGLWFDKGRLEALIERLKNRGSEEEALPEGDVSHQPSLLQQLAAFLEDTEPDGLSVGNRESTGVFGTVASAFGAGLGGSRQVLYDMMIMLGDLQKTGPGKGKKGPDRSGR